MTCRFRGTSFTSLESTGGFTNVRTPVRAQGSFPPSTEFSHLRLEPPARGRPGPGGPAGYTPLFNGGGGTGLRVSGLAHVLLKGARAGRHGDSLRVEAAPFMIVEGLLLQGAAVSAITANSCPA